ncbi:hypothetical protein JR316_0012998 [Psilocybe cubensis]|uniref:Uncharacterized protein n=2 Tax=Psilocybe cubensis TaxID=181762 RepID=A0A8H8CHG1_PSICU|nr:hypothetical protein JR316_0012998 [Psilocybe cubensis]KAH9474536.1 hypothetical protein JR316_0012998 [Psilocybe cubensis]
MEGILRFFQRPPPAIPPVKIELNLNSTSNINARLEYGPHDHKIEPEENNKSSFGATSRHIGPEPWTTPRHIPDNTDNNNRNPTNANATATVSYNLPVCSTSGQPSRFTFDFNLNASPTRVGVRGPRGNHQITSMYMLKAVLTDAHNWSDDDVEDFLAFIRKEARRTLDMTLPYRSQDEEAIDRVCETAIKEEHWPTLSEYEDCWPVRTALKLILKYRSTYLAQRRNLAMERPSDPASCGCSRDTGENAPEALPQEQEMET